MPTRRFPVAAFFFCRMPPLAYPLSVTLSAIAKDAKDSVEKVRVETGAPACPSRAKRGRLAVGSGRSPA